MFDLDRRRFGRLAFASGAVVGVGAAIWPLPATSAPDGRTRIGWVYVGPVSDHGWSYQHDLGRQGVDKALGDRVATTFIENVPEGPGAERAIEQLASSGHKLIFSTSFGFFESTHKVAQRYPQVLFENCTGSKRAKNVATYNSRFYQGRTVLGLIAGKMTRSNVVGYVASYPIPEVINSINAFALGLKETNPQAELRLAWTNSWYDPGREAELAKALIDGGADLLTQHTDSPAPVQVAEARGVWAFGQSSDMTRYGPKAHLTALVDDWDDYYIRRIRLMLDGEWTSGDFWGGFGDRMLHLTPFNPAVPAEVAALADKARDDIVAGTRHSFAGPIRDRDGKERVAAGATATDEQIHTMDWLVEGVVGPLQK